MAPGVVGLQPDHVHHLLDLIPALRVAAEAVDAQPLADAVADRGPRVQAGVRVLEDDLHPAPIGPELGALDPRDIRPIELDPARRRVEEAQDHPADRRLAAARLADEPERLAAPDVERDAVDRLDRADLALEDTAADREVLDEVRDADQRPVGGVLRRGRSSGEPRARGAGW